MGQTAGDAQIDEAGLFAAGDHAEVDAFSLTRRMKSGPLAASRTAAVAMAMTSEAP